MDRQVIEIVIADDHARLRAAIRKYLERAADIAVVGEAGNGREAVELVEKLDPDLLILDLEMPVMGGIEALQELRDRRSRGKCCAVPVLIFTASDLRANAPDLADLGAAGYIVKGEALGLMISTVRELARRNEKEITAKARQASRLRG